MREGTSNLLFMSSAKYFSNLSYRNARTTSSDKRGSQILEQGTLIFSELFSKLSIKYIS